jgi:hypothetical protein
MERLAGTDNPFELAGRINKATRLVAALRHICPDRELMRSTLESFTDADWDNLRRHADVHPTRARGATCSVSNETRALVMLWLDVGSFVTLAKAGEDVFAGLAS